MEKVELSLQTVNNVLGYLQERPFKESAPLIDLIVKEVQSVNKPKGQTEEVLTPKQLLTE